MTTLSQWKQTVILGLIEGLPLQDSVSAEALVDTYMIEAGGWVPDNNLDPTGAGNIANEATTDEVIAEIIENEYASIYESKTNLTVSFQFSTLTHLTPGLDEDEVRSAIDGLLRDSFRDHLVKLGFTVTNVLLDSSVSEEGGIFTKERRLRLETESPELSVSCLGLKRARAYYGLDNLWSVSANYIRPDRAAILILRRYENSTYDAVDSSTSYFYVVKIDPIIKTMISGVKIELE